MFNFNIITSGQGHGFPFQDPYNRFSLVKSTPDRFFLHHPVVHLIKEILESFYATLQHNTEHAMYRIILFVKILKVRSFDKKKKKKTN